MTLISLSVPYELRSFLVILNFLACAVLIIIRVHHLRNAEIESRKITTTCLSCQFLALIYCLTAANIQMEWYYDNIRWCSLSMKIGAATYALWRVLLYLFIIFRFEIVNQVNIVSPRIINIGKVVIVVAGIFMVVSLIVYAKGITDQHFNCLFEINNSIIIVLFMIDTSICVVGTWMFIRPLAQMTRDFGNIKIQFFLRRTKIWSIVCFVSTLVAALTVGVFNGAEGVFAFDCSVTSFSLVMMMSPMSERMKTMYKAQTEMVKERPSANPQIFSDPQLYSYTDLGKSDLLLNDHIEAILRGDSMSADD